MVTSFNKYLIYSLLVHSLFIFLFRVNLSPAAKREYYEIALVPKKYWAPAHNHSLFGTKTPSEIAKDSKSTGVLGPNTSDAQEIKRAEEDEASRPSYNKKEVLFKNWMDEVGERAVIPWFREVEKYLLIKQHLVGTYTTHVIVIVNTKSDVVRVVIEKGSGDLGMDLAVKNAFLGQQFRPAPKQLIDSDGFGRVRYWFEMELSENSTKKGKLHLYRTD